MKAHVIGIPGSGKTTLAQWFADKYLIPAFDLDYVVWDESGERAPSEIERRLTEIGRLPGWVTEGAYRQKGPEIILLVRL
jgi:adenylate kinase family enzyme